MADGRGKTKHKEYRYKVSTISNYVKSGMSDKEIASRLHLTLLQWDRYKSTHIDIINLYKEIEKDLKTPGKAFKWHDVQYIYDNIINYMGDRDKKKLPYTIPSLCAYLKISQDTYYHYLHENDNKQLIHTEKGVLVYTSISELLKNVHNLIEANLVDLATLRNSIGAIFVLKNHYGYSDKKQVEINDTAPINITWEHAPGALLPQGKAIDSDNVKLSEAKSSLDEKEN